MLADLNLWSNYTLPELELDGTMRHTYFTTLYSDPYGNEHISHDVKILWHNREIQFDYGSYKVNCGLTLNSGLGLDDLLASTTTPRLQTRCFAIHFLLNKVELLWCFTLGSLAIHNDDFSKARKRRWGGWWWQRRNRQVYVCLRLSDVSCPVANVARKQE